MQRPAVEGDVRSVSAARRVSAVVALLAPLALLAVVMVVLLRHPLALLAAAVCVTAGLSAAAFAITRTGLLRAGAAALAVAVILPLAAVGNLLAVALLVAVLLIGAAATRYALGRDMASLKHAPTPGDPVGPARRPVLLMNPRSGGARSIGSGWSRRPAGVASSRWCSPPATTCCGWPRRRWPREPT